MGNPFEEIYAKDVWGQGSGEGSHPMHNIGYSAFLESFLAEHNIQSVVVDIPPFNLKAKKVYSFTNAMGLLQKLRSLVRGA